VLFKFLLLIMMFSVFALNYVHACTNARHNGLGLSIFEQNLECRP